MLENLTVKQHLDHAIAQWEMIRDEGVEKSEYTYQNIVDVRGLHIGVPVNHCYLCEVYQRDNYNRQYLTGGRLFEENTNKNCKQCPLAPNGIYVECEHHGPYNSWKKSTRYVNCPQTQAHYANEIVELVKAHKIKINLGE